MYELKPCPFCGQAPTTRVRYWSCGGDELRLTAEVVCKCRVSKGYSFQGNNVTFDVYTDAFDEAISEWNRRADND